MTPSTPVRVPGGVCAAKGFLAGAITCGIKRLIFRKKDLALIASETPCAAAAVFTKNQVAAPSSPALPQAPRGRNPRAIIANSGNANAATGEPGRETTRWPPWPVADCDRPHRKSSSAPRASSGSRCRWTESARVSVISVKP